MPPIQETHYFANASNSVFNNLNITHIASTSERNGLRRLLDNISAGAFHDAAERGDPPKCHPHTRIAIRAEIMEWVNAAPEARRKFILWMYGPAGSGKTAIGQSIAEECNRRGLLAASFFFSRTAAGRSDTTRVVSTIIYQISCYLPEVGDRLLTTIERDPTIFSRSLATQMQVLMIDPLKSLPPLPRPIFVVLDGLDEAGPTPQDQANLLNVIETATSELQHIPLIFLIASRPEYEIREAFNGRLSRLTKSLVLDDNYRPYHDIRLYFNSTFKEIRDKHVRLGNRLPSPWPSESDIDRLVSKASGQFIFAATVLKFIDSIQHNPDKRLSIILGLSAPGNETPFALLDALYHYILSSVAEREEVLQILRILVLQNHNDPLAVGEIAELLDLDVWRTLVDMHALAFVPPPGQNNDVLRIHHASLYDFLMDRSRSHEFYIDTNQGHLDFTKRWWEVISNNQCSRILPLRTCMRCFIHHYRKSPGGVKLTDDLSRFDLKQLLGKQYNFDTLYTSPWEDFFECINQQAEDRPDWHNIVCKLEDEFKACIMERVSKYPPALQTYIPTILALSRTVRHGDDIFRLLLCGLDQPLTEGKNTHSLDSTLLRLDDLRTFPVDHIFHKFFYNDQSHLALVNQIVGIIFRKPGEDDHQVIFKQASFTANTSVLSLEDGSLCVQIHYRDFQWFPYMIYHLETEDSDLAMLLRERALQYDGNNKPLRTGRHCIALYSLGYIHKCSIPYLNHSHPPSTNRCIICERFAGTPHIVNLDQQNESDAAAVSPSSSPESPLRVAEVDTHSTDLEDPSNAIPVDSPAISVAPASSPAPILGNPNGSSKLPSSSEASAISEPATKRKRKREAQSLASEFSKNTRLKLKSIVS